MIRKDGRAPSDPREHRITVGFVLLGRHRFQPLFLNGGRLVGKGRFQCRHRLIACLSCRGTATGCHPRRPLQLAALGSRFGQPPSRHRTADILHLHLSFHRRRIQRIQRGALCRSHVSRRLCLCRFGLGFGGGIRLLNDGERLLLPLFRIGIRFRFCQRRLQARSP